MSIILHRKIPFNGRGELFHIVPVGDIHIGNAATDEELLKSVIRRIYWGKNTYWIGMGDYCEFINVKDPRFDPAGLADWIQAKHFVDLAQAQYEHLLEYLKPIAGKCLGLVEGNHEDSIKRHYERDVYSTLAADIKCLGGFDPDYKMKLGYYGWLCLSFMRSKVKETKIVINLHHGFGGGKLKGSKALNMERWLYTHACDLAIFGHTHNADAYRAGVDYIGNDGLEHTQTRRGIYSGTFLSGASYAERAGYLPLPLGGVEIILRPGAERKEDAVRCVT